MTTSPSTPTPLSTSATNLPVSDIPSVRAYDFPVKEEPHLDYGDGERMPLSPEGYGFSSSQYLFTISESNEKGYGEAGDDGEIFSSDDPVLFKPYKSQSPMGGINSCLSIERSSAIPLVSDTPTIILEMVFVNHSLFKSSILNWIKLLRPASFLMNNGTIIDNKICHPRNYDFYICAHAGMIGITRPTHYHVLMNEIGFTTDSLQELVHSLSYVFQRSTTAISVVAPICYAHLAATQVGQFVKFEDLYNCTFE
ncbi:hypothetical protein ZIOFF_005930 [Zingiber officinale]|uniref:Piwi domain-containing protein n=1 Tax=Zingiber officinale TaxID=94328 RepID=A0A8J5LV77_ZINOF|nr:hypothetical protein ZIOFF_005930 [Zingiber officinale]